MSLFAATSNLHVNYQDTIRKFSVLLHLQLAIDPKFCSELQIMVTLAKYIILGFYRLWYRFPSNVKLCPLAKISIILQFPEAVVLCVASTGFKII